MNFLRWWQDRARRRRAAVVLASLKAGAPAASNLVSAAVADTDPAAVRLALLRENFPFLPRDGWIPDLHDLGNLAELKAYFGKPANRKQSQHGRTSDTEAPAEFTRRRF